ncbi:MULTISPECIES: hypothetical protein [unclassified Streptomyces]|uniref:hypothetical protein n=1 Tax=unclassified Streptomyces TaxID=2593676 RepID=UPI000CD5550D|nr:MULTISPECIES: hypothetical protein [unclassified Streptomyces]
MRTRATTLRLPPDQVRLGDFLSVGGETMHVTFAEHRGGIIRLELNTSIRLSLPPAASVTITRPYRRP